MDETYFQLAESMTKEFKFIKSPTYQNLAKVMSSPKYQALAKSIASMPKSSNLPELSMQAQQAIVSVNPYEFSFPCKITVLPPNSEKLFSDYAAALRFLSPEDRHNLVEVAKAKLEKSLVCELNKEEDLPLETDTLIEKITSVFVELKDYSKLEIFKIFLEIMVIIVTICCTYVAHEDAEQAHLDAVPAHQDFIASQTNNTDANIKQINTPQNK